MSRLVRVRLGHTGVLDFKNCPRFQILNIWPILLSWVIFEWTIAFRRKFKLTVISNNPFKLPKHHKFHSSQKLQGTFRLPFSSRIKTKIFTQPTSKVSLWPPRPLYDFDVLFSCHLTFPWIRLNMCLNWKSLWHCRFLVPCNTQKILTEIWHQIWDKNMVKIYANKIILRSHEPFQI